MTSQVQCSHDDGGVPLRPGSSPRVESDREVVRRSYIDRDGLTWEVREVAGVDVPGARGGRCLVFESPVVIRRVWDVPPDWRALSPDELSALSWRK
jgi:hypothetical protein